MIQECPQLQNLPANVRKFWEEKQSTLDDTLLRFSYGVLVEAKDVMLRETGGLAYLMRRNLWFEDFPKSSIFSSLFQSKAPYTKTQLQFPLTRITEVRLVPPSELGPLLCQTDRPPGKLLKILQMFNPKPTVLFLAGKDAVDRNFRYAFRDLDDPDAWYQTLSEYNQ